MLDQAEVIDCSKEENVKKLYQMMSKATIAKAYSMLGRSDLASEIAQEVFIKLWENKPRFKGKKAAYAWIYKSCHNRCIDYLRSASYRYEKAEDEFSYFKDESLSLGQRTVNRDLLAKIIVSLSKEESQILYYLVLDEMTQKEIAQMMQKSLRTVQRQIKKINDKFSSLRTGT